MKQTVNENPKKFEVGKVYEVRDTNCRSGHTYTSVLYTVIKRTAQFVTFENEKGETKRVKVQLTNNKTVEWVNYNSTSGLAGLTANRVYETEAADIAIEDHAEDNIETETATSAATVATKDQEVAVQAEIANTNNASEKASKVPFSDEEAALLDKIEKAAADNILLQHGNHEAAHQATLDREAAEAELGKLAMEAHKSGNDKHFKLLFNEMQARIERGTKFGSENESAAGQYVRGELTYKPFGNRSIIAGNNDVADKIADMDKSPTEVMLEELAKGFDVVIKTYGETRKIEMVTVATLKEAFDIV